MQVRIKHIALVFLLLNILVGNRVYAGNPPTANFDVDNATPVVGETVTFTDQSSNGTFFGSTDPIVSWSWHFGAGALPENANSSGPHDIIFTSEGEKTVSLEVTTQRGQSNTETKNNYISVSCSAASSIIPSGPVSTIYGSMLSLDGNPTGSYGTYDNHEWTGDGVAYLSATNIQAPIFSGAPVGTYNLTYTVTDSYGCNGTDNITIEVTPATLTVSAGNQTVIYGTPASTVTQNGTYTILGFVNGDNSSVISGLNSVSYSTNYAETTNAGTSGITITPGIGGLAADNYSFSAVSGSVTIDKADQFIISGVFPFTKPLNEFIDEPVPLNITASSGLPVEITLESGSAATLNYDGNETPPYFLTDIGTTGLVTIHINQPGNVNYNAAEQETRIFDVTKSNQSISFPEIDDITYFSGLTLELSAVASSGLIVNYTVEDGPATVAGNILSVTGAGEIWVTASQNGDASYNMASDITRSFLVNKGSQTISINVPDEPLTESTQITATSTSGLPVALTLGIGSAASSLDYNAGGDYYTLSGIQSTGEIYIVGNQAGNNNFLPADQVIQTIDLDKQNQVISFTTIADQTYSPTLTVPLSATASSGLPVLFNIVSGPATLAVNTLTINGTGTVVVEASQSGNSTYNPAPTVTQQFEVEKAIPVITQNDISKTYGDAVFSVNPTSTSNGTFSFVSGNTEIFTMSGNTATIIGAGTTVLDISQQPTANYFGTTKTVVFSVNKAPSTISVTGVTDYIYNASPQGPDTSDATGSTGTVSYSYEGSGSTNFGPSATKPTNAGTYTVTAAVEADDNYAGATSAPYAFTINKADATININAYSVTYNGSEHLSAGSATGVSSENLSGLDLSGTAHTSAGDYNDAWIFTDVTGNYNDDSGNVNNVISPKSLTVTADDQVKCYGDELIIDGSEFSSTGLVAGETIGNVTLSSLGFAVGAVEGTYSIVPSNATGGTFNPANYSITYFDGELTVKSPPTLASASLEETVCEGSEATINLSGLLPDEIFSLDYFINGVAQPTKTGLSSDAAGNESFTTTALSESNDGQFLQITQITNTSETPNCTQSFTENVTLSVNPLPTLSDATQDGIACDGSPATIKLMGLIPNTTFSLAYTIDGVDQPPVENIIADGSGNSSFSTQALTFANNGQTLQIYGIQITSETPGCVQGFNQDVILEAGELISITTQPESAPQFYCQNTLPNDLSVTASGTNLSYQWFRDENSTPEEGDEIPVGNNNNTFTPPTSTPDTSYYYCLITGTCGTVTSDVSGAITVYGTTITSGTVGGASELVLCAGGNPGSFSVGSPTGGDGNYTYQWEESEGCSATWTDATAQDGNTTSLTFNPPALNDTMCYRLKITDGCGNVGYSATKTYNVVPDATSQTINPIPASGTSICVDETVSATFSGGSGGTGTINDVYEYSTDGGSSWNSYTPGNDITATSGMTGTNMIQIRTRRTATGSGCNFGDWNYVEWTVQPLPTATISGDATICEGESATITVDLTGTPDWNLTFQLDGTNYLTVENIPSSPYIFNVTEQGTYTVRAVSDANCTGNASGSAMVTVNELNMVVSDETPTPSGNHCPEFGGPFNPDNSDYNAGVTEVIFKVSKEESTTGNWTFDFAIDETGDVEVYDLVSVKDNNDNTISYTGDDDSGNLDAGDNTEVIFTFWIVNKPGNQLDVEFTVSNGNDGICDETGSSDDNSKTHVINVMPAVGSFTP